MSPSHRVEANSLNLLTRKEVASRFKVSLRHVDRLVTAQTLPKPVRLGKRVKRWREADLMAFIERLAK